MKKLRDRPDKDTITQALSVWSTIYFTPRSSHTHAGNYFGPSYKARGVEINCGAGGAGEGPVTEIDCSLQYSLKDMDFFKAIFKMFLDTCLRNSLRR